MVHLIRDYCINIVKRCNIYIPSNTIVNFYCQVVVDLHTYSHHSISFIGGNLILTEGINKAVKAGRITGFLIHP